MSNEMIGKYEILEKRGEGGFGVLYKAMDPMIERVVALKVLHTQYASNERLSAWFKREAKAMARLNHPNIVTIHNFEIEGDRHFIVMEYVEGSNLDEDLKKGGPMPIDDVIKAALQMVDGFGYAHENGIVHRDIKPSNIMVDRSGKVKITDFGIAKILGDSKLTKTGTGAGSLHYMSPEQIEGRPIDTRTDIYSLGITLYQMITGKVPFSDESEFVVMRAHLDQIPTSPSELRSDTPPELDRIVLKMLEKKPEDRYDSMQTLARELKRLAGPVTGYDRVVEAEPIDDLTVPMTPTPRRHDLTEAERPSEPKTGSKVPAIGGALVLVIAVAVVSYLVFFRGPETPSDAEAVADSTLVAASDSLADTSGLKGGVATIDTTPTEPVGVVRQTPVPIGKLVIEISPFDFRDRPTVVFGGNRMTVDDIPFEIAGIENGWHRVCVYYKDGSFFDDVYINDDTQTRTYKFNGPTGRVSIGAEFVGQEKQPWAEILIDDKLIEVGTPTSVDLVEGPHKILVRKDGYELVGSPKIIRVKAGENNQVSFKLRRK
jgi:predicted Ser/Thr protein kinase